MLFVVLFYFLVGGCSLAAAASYAECSPACNLPPMTCNYIDYNVYTPGLDFPSLESNVSQIITIAEGIKEAFPACYASIQTFVCAYYYPSCNNATNQKMKPCVNMCTTTNVNCAFLVNSPLLPPEYKAILNCSATDENGEFFWEQSNSACTSLTNTAPICEATNSSGDDVTGNCEAYSTEQTPNTAHICAPFVSDEIFVPSAFPQSFLDSFVNSSTLWLIQRIYPIMPLACYRSVLSLLCQTAFPKCSRANMSSTILATPSFPCRSLCQRTNDVCQEFFGFVNQTLFDCEDTDLFSGKNFSQWPVGPSYTLTTGGGRQVSVECATEIFAEDSKISTFVPPAIVSCPFPMAKKTHPKESDSPCWIPCPDPTYSSKQWDDLITVGKVFSSISFVLMVFMVISALMDSNKRSFPANIHIFEMACAGLISIAFFINGSNPKEDVWCEDPVTYASIDNNSACGAQGFIFMLFTLCTLTWWLVLAFNMFAAIILGWTKELGKFKYYYHGFAWGIPLIFTIAVAAKGEFGYTPPASWCFIATAGINIAGETLNLNGLDFGLFYIPILIGIGIACILLVAVFVKIVKISRATRNITAKGSASSSIAFQAQKRIITLVAVLIVLFALVFEWRIALNNAVTEEFKTEDFAWGLCKIKQQLNIPDAGSCPGETPPKVFDYRHTTFLTFLCASIGIFMFLIFGTDIKIYKMWYYFIKCARQGKWDTIKTAIKDSETLSATSSTQRSSSGTPLAVRRGNNSPSSSSNASSRSSTNLMNSGSTASLRAHDSSMSSSSSAV